MYGEIQHCTLSLKRPRLHDRRRIYLHGLQMCELYACIGSAGLSGLPLRTLHLKGIVINVSRAAKIRIKRHSFL